MGGLLLGTTAAPTGSSTTYAKLVLRGNTVNNNEAYFALGRGSAAVSGQSLGSLWFIDNADGQFARIDAQCDGTPGASDFPGRLSFWTTADGASSPTERVRIDSSGKLRDGNVSGPVTSGDLEVTPASGSATVVVGRLSSTTNDNTTFRVRDRSDNTLLSSSPSIPLQIGRDGSEFARIDTFGRLLVGTSSARSNYRNSIAPTIQLEETSDKGLCVFTNIDASSGPYIWLGKSRGTSVGSSTIVQANDVLGSIRFNGADGSDVILAASVRAEIDGTPGAGDMPGRLVFSTTADGSASPTERLRIDSSNYVLIGGTTAATADIALNADGSASFADNVNARYVVANEPNPAGTGTGCFQAQLNGTTNARINADGSANFAGGDGYAVNQSLGITRFGGLLQRDDASLANLHQVYKGGSAASNVTYTLRNDGSASFGVGTSATTNTAGVSIYKNNSNAAFAPLYVSQGSASGNLITGHNGATGQTTFAVSADGSASFAGTVKVGSPDYTSSTVSGINLSTTAYYTQQPAANNSNNTVHSHYHGSTEVYHLKNDGSASFAGQVSSSSAFESRRTNDKRYLY